MVDFLENTLYLLYGTPINIIWYKNKNKPLLLNVADIFFKYFFGVPHLATFILFLFNVCNC
jgi:hypothetical protein